MDNKAWSNFILTPFGLTESLCQKDNFSCHTTSLKKKDKCGIMFKKKKKLITIYNCGCAISTAVEIFKCSPDFNTMEEELNALHNISEFIETI